MKWVRWFFYVTGSLFCLVIVIGMFSKSEPKSGADAANQAGSAQAAEPAKADDAPSMYITTAVALYDAYKNNEVATDNAIAGRSVMVNGTVQAITKDFLEQVVIRLQGEHPFEMLMMTMKKDQTAEAARLSPGQEVVLVCAKMKLMIGSPMGERCVFRH